MKTNIFYYVGVLLRGLAMGAADVVPGVSGGTIAFITGIYEKLINSIKNINIEAFRLLFRDGFASFWKYINGWFLLSLMLGIGVSIFSLAKAISYALATYPLFVWAFFFGLILASAWILLKKIEKYDFSATALLAAGAVLAYFITRISPADAPDSPLYIFLTGFIAICAMILPGISGSFIMLLMGSYAKVITAVHELDFPVIIIFAAGALLGITTFSRVLSWLFKKYHNGTIAILTGFMIGSITKVWPWQNTLATGEIKNVWPSGYEGDPNLLAVTALMLFGFVLIVAIERIAEKISKEGNG